jgi:hypothetical protein
MMLVLALRSDAQGVYEKALHYFSPEELAEAFAATRGVASPTQLRNFMKRDGRDLLVQFRALAPPHAPITVQRWSFRRVGLILLTLGIVVAAGPSAVALLPEPRRRIDPRLRTGRTMVLMAQSVPSANSSPPSGRSSGVERLQLRSCAAARRSATDGRGQGKQVDQLQVGKALGLSGGCDDADLLT